MNQSVAFPFLTLQETAIVAGHWQIALDRDDFSASEEFVSNWDYASTIRLSRSLSVDLERASQQLGIPKNEIQLAITTRIGTGNGRLPRLILKSSQQPIPYLDHPFQQEVEIGGANLSSVLDVHTQILLGKEPLSKTPISPGHNGEVLWSDRLRTRIEGEEPRFPIEVIDFQEFLGAKTASGAPWYLHWNPDDWNREFHGAVRLFLNATRQDILKRIEDQDPLILQTIMADVMVQICTRLLMEANYEEILSTCENGSIAAQAKSWLSLAWPNRSPNLVLAVLRYRPGEFSASLLALSELSEN